jgi:hypothetical protein
MTQHISPQDTLEDRRALARLGYIVGSFLAFTAIMAIGVGLAFS